MLNWTLSFLIPEDITMCSTYCDSWMGSLSDNDNLLKQSKMFQILSLRTKVKSLIFFEGAV